MVGDFLVVGGGMAGASAGYFLARSGSVTLLEMEPAAGYHSTGRSAALFSEYYGNRVVRALTAASRQFYAAPPPGFRSPLLAPRGVLSLCPLGAEDRFEQVLADGLTAPTPVREISPREVQRRCPVVRPGWYSRAMLKPAAMDIDVDAVHQGFLRGIRARGGRVLTSARVRDLSWRGGMWRARTGAGEFAAPTVLNASGAWADEVAALAGVRPVGQTPLRRTVFTVAPPAGARVAGWPMVADVTDTFYVKPESGQLLISPADATPMPPGDSRPDDLDVAVAADRVEEATTLVIRHVRRAWAGLRCAVPDDTPVLGEAPDAPGFLWVCGLSGYGIQTAPAVGRIAAALATSSAAGAAPADLGFDLSEIAPNRCLRSHCE
jgi:glycine/D-amino acid oxidase-like deaminating enzyme